MDTSYFVGKTALVTGANSGIGEELTRRLVRLGCRVIGVARNETRLLELKRELGDQLTVVSADLVDWETTERELAPYCKEVDFLVNNAAYAFCCPCDQVPVNQLDMTLAVNLKGPIRLIGMVAKGMKERKFGSIVNISSVAGLVALDEHLAYAASKAALDMVTKVCAKELGAHNIRVNSINPTVVWTAMGREHWSEPGRRREMTSKIPMGRFVEVREAVEPIIFLLSNSSSMINGTLIPVDGGFVAT